MKSLRESGFPRANWFFIRGLPTTTTPEDLSAWFRERGIDIPTSHLSVKENGRSCTAIIAIPKNTLLTLLTWAINGGKFRGYNVNPEHMHQSEKTQRSRDGEKE